MVQLRVIVAVALLISLCILEGTASYNAENTVDEHQRKKRETFAAEGNDFEEQQIEAREEGSNDYEEIPSPTSYLLNQGLYNGSNLLMKRKAGGLFSTVSKRKITCKDLLKDMVKLIAATARMSERLERLSIQLKGKKPGAGLGKECRSEGNFEYNKRCYFLTKDEDYFNADTCSSHKAGSTLASITTASLFNGINGFFREILNTNTSQYADDHEIRAWTWGSFDPSLKKDEAVIRWGDGKSIPMIGKWESYWFNGAPFTTDQKDHYEDYTHIVIAVSRNEDDDNQGFYNHPGTHFKPSLCVYE